MSGAKGSCHLGKIALVELQGSPCTSVIGSACPLSALLRRKTARSCSRANQQQGCMPRYPIFRYPVVACTGARRVQPVVARCRYFRGQSNAAFRLRFGLRIGGCMKEIVGFTPALLNRSTLSCARRGITHKCCIVNRKTQTPNPVSSLTLSRQWITYVVGPACAQGNR